MPYPHKVSAALRSCPYDPRCQARTAIVILCQNRGAVMIVQIHVGVGAGAQIRGLDGVLGACRRMEPHPVVVPGHMEIVGLPTPISADTPGLRSIVVRLVVIAASRRDWIS